MHQLITLKIFLSEALDIQELSCHQWCQISTVVPLINIYPLSTVVTTNDQSDDRELTVSQLPPKAKVLITLKEAI